MHTGIKKEVSCKALDPLFYYARLKKVNLNEIIEGVQYDLVYLSNKRERINWSDWCKIISNARAFFSTFDFEEMGNLFVKSNSYKAGLLPAFFIFSSTSLSRFLARLIFKNNSMMFSCIRQQLKFINSNHVRIIVELDEKYEFCPEFFYISKGYWAQLGTELGHKNFNFVLNIEGRKGIFDASWHRENFFFRTKRGLRWAMNIKQALVEMTESQEELLKQYEIIDISQKLLQKQRIQFNVANEILKSIKQSFDVEETLNSVSATLLKAANFSAVLIELFKDMDENELKIKVQAGDLIDALPSIKRLITINDKHIGNLIAYPKKNMGYQDVNDLIDYLIPLVNITVYNTIILRTIVDFKDNLERKVSERTYELQTARDELARTNKMLKQAQVIQNNFFTNISHEFRTPLTLILGPSKQLSVSSSEEKTKATADLIHRNAKKLNKLVDELLDIAKIETGEMKLTASPLNIVELTKEIAHSFYSLAERKKITLNLISDLDEVIIYVDKEKVDKILTNVLSNAFKFTPDNGKISVTIKSSKRDCDIAIADSGTGIPRNELEKIFDRFYQVDGSHTREYEGTGIGLSLTKELIELHKGQIKVESQEGKGSVFHLLFPLGKEHLKPEEVFENHEAEQKAETISELVEDFSVQIKHTSDFLLCDESELPTLLVVEDNQDVRNFIINILSKRYKICEAEDGEEGIEKSFKHIPDLIITDIMMPKMDGFQFCNKLKSDFRTCHIPIIMLTAKATMNDKITGLELGADDYIMKPFEAEELKARIKNLIEQRDRLHAYFRKFGYIEKAKQNISSSDELFIQKTMSIINENLSDSAFGIEQLAEKLAVSRALLFKKMNHLTGDSPGEIIKILRLNKAAILIEKNSGNISEIALEVGFNNPSYFSECFKKQFGVLPSQYHLNKQFS